MRDDVTRTTAASSYANSAPTTRPFTSVSVHDTFVAPSWNVVPGAGVHLMGTGGGAHRAGGPGGPLAEGGAAHDEQLVGFSS